MDHAMLRPAVALVAWTLVMLAWAVAVRLPAMRAAGIQLSKLVGTHGADADRALPAAAQWKVHNYNHLLEQPTLFYVVCLVLAGVGGGHPFNIALAWAYVGFRILHSLVQATVNRVAVRFVFFLLSSLVLAALTLHAGIAVF